MKNLTRPFTRRVWLAAVAVTAAVAAGIVAGPGSATPSVRADYSPYPPKAAKLKAPKLKQGTLTVTGTKRSDKITLRLQAGDPGILQVDFGDDGSADFSFERSQIAKIAVKARAGADQVGIDEGNGLFTDSIPTTLDGGDGNDRIAGGKGIETLLGGKGSDSIDGNGGNDLAVMGPGDDTFVWDPGDGSDTVEGQGGTDTMLFNGANVAEQVDFNALGGADVVTVNDLTGTDVNSVIVDLAATLGGVAGDGQSDRVVVNATNGDDTIDVNGDAGGLKVSGLAATTEILHSEAANDRLELNTLAGRDTVDSGGLAAGAIQLFEDGVFVP
jgi:Ca2+-binding RTX toxin-like protein